MLKIDRGRSSDPLVNDYKLIYKSKYKNIRRVSLKDDIFKTWRDIMPTINGPISKFLLCLNFRNWLAHGRYWNGNFITFLPIEVNEVTRNLFKKFEHIDDWE